MSPANQCLTLACVQECGIIGDAESTTAAVKEEAEEAESAGHRVLIFAQLKALLDIVERDVLQPAGVSFLRLDGRCGNLSLTERLSGFLLPYSLGFRVFWI